MTDLQSTALVCPKCQGSMRSYERSGITIRGHHGDTKHRSEYGGKRKRGGFLGELFD